HLHSEYSLLDGACRIKAIPAYALAMGMSAVALTDHGAMYGAVEFYNACKSVGVKPIIGCEVYLAPESMTDRTPREGNPYYHLVLLCKDQKGYKNLIYMVSKSFTEGFYQKPRIDMELLREHSEGLVCLSGCLGGKIPQLILKNNISEAYSHALEMKEIFGEDFYIEIQDHGLQEEKQILPVLADISKKYSIPLVATNDVHYMKKKDAELQNVLVCMQTNNVVSESNPLGFESDEYYFKDEFKMRQLFAEYPDAIDNTAIIAEKCDFEFDFSKYIYPKISFDEDLTAEQYLKKLTLDGFEDKVSKGKIKFVRLSREKYLERIKYELNVICSMGYAEYFLIVADFVNYARNNDIPTSPGRGSGAGSLVAYLINITEVDSLEYGLLFDAFLNPERVSMPDFDIDFSDTKRPEVINYVKNKYGLDRVCQIITFGTLAPRAAVRSVGKALGMAYADVDEVAKKIPREKKVTLDDVMNLPEIKKMMDTSEAVRKLLNFSRQVEGMPKNISTHAAGVVICDKPIYEYVPLAVSGEDLLTQYNMNDIASLGLLKFDFLGIRYLTVIDDTVKMIQEKDLGFDLFKIPLDDKKTYELLSAGKTDGVFQLESAGMKQMLGRYRPKTIRHIKSAIAHYRPGPAKFIDKYIENSADPSKIKYTLPTLAPILDETYGCIVYQEQVMEIFRAIAGYTYGKADIVRRAISKKKADVIAAERENFINGAVALGAEPNDAEELFEDMKGFSDYGFKKAHAAGYAFVSYRTAYLKANYPAYYMASLLTSVLGDMGKTALYVNDAKKLGIDLMPPDVNTSGLNFTVTDDGNIRYGLLALRNVGVGFVKELIAERRNKPFTSFSDFIERMIDKDLNKRQVESLIKSGAFDSLGVFRSSLLAVYEKMIDLCSEKHRSMMTGQVDLFGNVEREDSVEYPDLPDFTVKEKLALEREVSGLCFSGHLIDEYKDIVSKIDRTELMRIMTESSDNQNVTVCGVVSGITRKSTRSGKDMAFVTLEDETAEVEIVIFPDMYASKRELFTVDAPLVIKGRVSQKEDEYPKIVAESADLITTYSVKEADLNKPAVKSDRQTLYLRVGSVDCPEFKRSLAIVDIFDGSCAVVFYDKTSGKYIKITDRGISPTDFVVRQLIEILGSENVVLR
ncbi:MAG: DNA polymerase III subunit alpha, partial [Clostridia bacterium]|nr:DNA polymerase III subunit alpha [Clostridia bacterium]